MVMTANIGFRVFPRIGGEDFNGPTSDFEQVAQILEQQFGSPDSDASIQTGSALAEAAASVPGVLRATASWGSGVEILRSSDSLGGLIPVTFDPSAENPQERLLMQSSRR
ncbi:unannotated protein [freshwater metagenome]|uniref:Unannotated protein n=1 Tax=freshwater metagenome TaxID=449393 RepID=A0A6J7L744_9ZZZZ